MMHYGALLAEARDDQALTGWNPDKNQKHDWDTMTKNV
jgi:hypothetical protein